MFLEKPSIIRGHLHSENSSCKSSDSGLPRWNWFIRALPRFAGFRTVSLQLQSISARARLWFVVGCFKSALEPLSRVMQIATGSEVCTARSVCDFHPVQYRDRCREQGIPLELEGDCNKCIQFRTTEFRCVG